MAASKLPNASRFNQGSSEARVSGLRYVRAALATSVMKPFDHDRLQGIRPRQNLKRSQRGSAHRCEATGLHVFAGGAHYRAIAFRHPCNRRGGGTLLLLPLRTRWRRIGHALLQEADHGPKRQATAEKRFQWIPKTGGWSIIVNSHRLFGRLQF